MGQGNVGYGLDFRQLQYTPIGLPLVEPIKESVVGAQVLRHPALPSNGTVEHPTEGDTIDGSRMDAETNNPARILIHDDQDPMGSQCCRLAPEQIHAPEAVFHVAQESQPGRTTGGLSRPVVMAENPANHVLVDLDVERQGDLLGDSRTAPAGITLLHFDDRTDEFGARTLRAGLPAAIRGRTASGTFRCSWICEGPAVSKASVQLRNGADEWDVPRVPLSRRGCGPMCINSAIVVVSESRSRVGA